MLVYQDNGVYSERVTFKMGILCFLSFFLIAIFRLVQGECSYYYTGDTDCVSLDGYQYAQWAICMSKSTVEAQTNRHCSSSYCYYQCMADLYGKESGSVYGNCTCSYYYSSRREYNLYTASWCFDETSTACGWYTSCLQRQVSCTGSKKNLVEFAEKFCNLVNSNNNGGFDSKTQIWLSSVSGCFRDRLRTFLRPWYENPCTGVQQTYTSCYGKYSQQLQSVLNVSPAQFWAVFWSMKSLFHNAYTTALWDLASLWSHQVNFPIPRVDLKIIKITVKHSKSYSDDDAEFSSSAVDAIASKQNWLNRGMLWYSWSYSFQSAEYTGDVDVDSYDIIVLLANRVSYDKSTSLNNVANPNMTSEIETFAKSVGDGHIVVGVYGFDGCAQVMEVGMCSDLVCLEPTRIYDRTSQTYHYDGCSAEESGHGVDIMAIFGGVVGTLVVLVILVCICKRCCGSGNRSGSKSTSNTVSTSRPQNSKQVVPRNTSRQVATMDVSAIYVEKKEYVRSNGAVAAKTSKAYVGPGGAYKSESGGIVTGEGAMVYSQEADITDGRLEFSHAIAAVLKK